jgi:hypothetical protein
MPANILYSIDKHMKEYTYLPKNKSWNQNEMKDHDLELKSQMTKSLKE